MRYAIANISYSHLVTTKIGLLVEISNDLLMCRHTAKSKNGIGIHAGMVVAANISSEIQLSYDLAGDRSTWLLEFKD